MLSNLVDSACRLSPSFFYCIGARRSSNSDPASNELLPLTISPPSSQVDSGGGGSAEVMVYSLGWGMGEPERRGADRKRSQPPAALAPLSPDDGLEVDVLPLHNQVGGHTRLLVLNDSTVIKPLNIRELHFYQNIPEDIQAFVPRYKGVMQASHSGGGTLDKRYSPCFPEGRKSSLGNKRRRDDVFKFKVHRNGNATEVIKSIAHMDNSNKQYFLMMENITSSYRRPCVLDLKMGTRQHGDDASAEKRSKQIAKCQATTSAALGVRLCGMQMFADGVCLRRDKYWGRALSEAGLRDALREFFSAGAGATRVRVVRAALRRLQALRRVVAKQTSYRFYSCSLLIVYEGDVSGTGSSSEEEDEAEGEEGSEAEEGDAGDESSSSSLPSSSAGHFDMSTLTEHFLPPPDEDARGGFDEAGGSARAASPDSADSWHAYPRAPRKRRRPSAPPDRVDIRMIDFAHTACAAAAAESPLATTTPHTGPDCGFLTGVDSLQRLLTDILRPDAYS